MSSLVYAPFQKVEPLDDGTIRVWGIASSETRDSADESVTAEAMRKALPEFLTFGNIREMHQPIAAGVAIEANIDADGVTNIGAHIVDPGSVKKVQAGVLKGFSIGGRVTKRNKEDRSIIEGIKLMEISLVDRPANPDALISLVKFDKNGRVVKTADAAPDPHIEETPTMPAQQTTTRLRKGMYDVERLASLVTSLYYLTSSAIYERDSEGDGSMVPDNLKQLCLQMCQCLCDMVDEETRELLGLMGIADAGALLENAAKTIEAGNLAKATPTLDALNKTLAECATSLKKLGAPASGTSTEDTSMPDSTTATAGADTDALNKVTQLTGENATLKSANEVLTKAQTDLTTALAAKTDELTKAVSERDAVLAESDKLVKNYNAAVKLMRDKGIIRAVPKEADGTEGGTEKAEPSAADLRKGGDFDTEMRKSFATPITV